jgi:hypothetical protein
MTGISRDSAALSLPGFADIAATGCDCEGVAA